MTLFPAAKDDFTAENGVTYTWEDNRWRTKAYQLDDEALDDYLTKNNPRPECADGVARDWMEQSSSASPTDRAPISSSNPAQPRRDLRSSTGG